MSTYTFDRMVETDVQQNAYYPVVQSKHYQLYGSPNKLFIGSSI